MNWNEDRSDYDDSTSPIAELIAALVLFVAVAAFIWALLWVSGAIP